MHENTVDSGLGTCVTLMQQARFPDDGSTPDKKLVVITAERSPIIQISWKPSVSLSRINQGTQLDLLIPSTPGATSEFRTVHINISAQL
jgi:hypothetical protein